MSLITRFLPACIDRLGRVGGDVQDRAVVIGVAAIYRDPRVIGHELDHLEHAVRAGDVRDRDVRFEVLRRPLAVREDAVQKDGRHRRILNDRRL